MGALISDCWFCGRMRFTDDLIAGFDDWDEQRLACSDCNRLLEHMAARGYTFIRIEAVESARAAALSGNPETPDVRD